MKSESEIVDFLCFKSRFFADAGRPIKVTFCNGYYGSPSTLILEVQGSPIRGRAIICSNGRFDQVGNFKIFVQNAAGGFSKISEFQRFYLDQKIEGWGAHLVDFAFSKLSDHKLDKPLAFLNSDKDGGRA